MQRGQRFLRGRMVTIAIVSSMVGLAGCQTSQRGVGARQHTALQNVDELVRSRLDFSDVASLSSRQTGSGSHRVAAPPHIPNGPFNLETGGYGMSRRSPG